MKLLKLNNLTKAQHTVALIAACAFAISCTKGGSISSSSTTNNVTGTIAVTAAFPTASGSSWTPVTGPQGVYIKGLALTVEGTCSRGIDTIKVNEGGPDYTETATCGSDGTFAFNKTYTATTGEGPKTLTFTAYDAAGLAVTGATTTKDVRIDATSPAIPVITTPATTPYNHNGASAAFTILGTCAGDVDHIIGPAGVVIACTAGAWSYPVTLTAGGTLNVSFQSYDLAGNTTGTTPQQILWSPTVIMYAAGPQSGGIIADASVANYTLEATQDQMSASNTDAFTSFSITTGFNYIINLVRGP